MSNEISNREKFFIKITSITALGLGITLSVFSNNVRAEKKFMIFYHQINALILTNDSVCEREAAINGFSNNQHCLLFVQQIMSFVYIIIV